jgi:hypothetical protein
MIITFERLANSLPQPLCRPNEMLEPLRLKGEGLDLAAEVKGRWPNLTMAGFRAGAGHDLHRS